MSRIQRVSAFDSIQVRNITPIDNNNNYVPAGLLYSTGEDGQLQFINPSSFAGIPSNRFLIDVSTVGQVISASNTGTYYFINNTTITTATLPNTSGVTAGSFFVIKAINTGDVTVSSAAGSQIVDTGTTAAAASVTVSTGTTATFVAVNSLWYRM